MNKFPMVVTLGIALAFLACSRGPLAGGSTDTELGVVKGSFSDEQGRPASNIAVLLLPYGYNPLTDGPLPDAQKDTTGPSGTFTFRNVVPSVYNIQAEQADANKAALVTGVLAIARDTVVERDVTLRETGTVKIAPPHGVDTVTGYVYVPGTTLFTRAQRAQIENGYIILAYVPPGVLPSLFYADRNLQSPEVLSSSIVVAPGSISTVAGDSVQFSRDLFLNTTVSGAGVTGDNYSFPVLVRLTKNNFDFSSAKNDGSDLRFAKPDNTPLSFEIEQWDAVNQKAAIWVKVDTVYGNNNSHYFSMVWGMRSSGVATGSSNGAAVFDTAQGFLGVWHLGNNCYDATFNKNNGISYGTIDTEGITGYCKKFNGSDSIKIAGLLGIPASITLSAWVSVDTSTPHGEEIVSLGDDVLMRTDDATFSSTYGSFHGDTTWFNFGVNTVLAKTGWHHLSFTFDAARHSQLFYLDGLLVKTGNDPHLINYSGLGINTLIGAHGNGSQNNNFHGAIDEVRVSQIARSADWIKLSFMNQKENDALVEFGK
jgi:hypothetical protein